MIELDEHGLSGPERDTGRQRMSELTRDDIRAFCETFRPYPDITAQELKYMFWNAAYGSDGVFVVGASSRKVSVNFKPAVTYAALARMIREYYREAEDEATNES